MGRKPNTLKSAMIRKCILEKDPRLQIEPKDFSEEVDSTILVRERVKGTKLEGNFKKVRGQIISQKQNTITVLPKSGKQVIFSKRDVAKMGQEASSSEREQSKKKPKMQKKPSKSTPQIWRDSTSSEEMGQPRKAPEIEQHTEQEITPQETERKEIEMKKPQSEIDEQSTKEETAKFETVKEEERKEEEQMPIKGEVKWEKEKKPKPTRS